MSDETWALVFTAALAASGWLFAWFHWREKLESQDSCEFYRGQRDAVIDRLTEANAATRKAEAEAWNWRTIAHKQRDELERLLNEHTPLEVET